MSGEKNILFIGLNHRINDPRLCYREIQTIKDELPDSAIYFLEKKKDAKYRKIEIERENFHFNSNTIHRIQLLIPIKRNKILNYILDRLYSQPLSMHHLIKECKKLNIDLIQASDARELFLAVLLSKFCDAEIMYDSHEDYYRQIIDYRQGNVIKYFSALKVHMMEVALIRFFSSIFCTDEFLLEKYQNRIYGAKNVFLLRNFPTAVNANRKTALDQSKTLKLVYIGGVNKFRGVIECANYVHKFNSEFVEQKLTFDVYSADSLIVENLREKGLINHISWIDYLKLMDKMPEYDIGICLWLPIKKFYRNLPLKNFDYMSVGLPIITSNFGNLKTYILESNAGICINPLSYDEFKEAILKMFNPNTRQEYRQNGLKWIQNKGLFRNEAKNYIEFIKNLR